MKYKIIKNKRGNLNVFISIGIILMLTILTVFFLVYFQINVIANNVRQNLFYSANNAILAMNVQSLAYGKYNMDIHYAKELIEDLLNKNAQGAISNIEVKSLKLENIEGGPNLYAQVVVKFKTIVNFGNDNEYKITMQDTVPISLLKYGGEN